MIEIYAVKLNTNLNEVTFNEFITHIDMFKQEYIRKFKNNIDADRSLLGNILVRTVICQKLKIKNYKIKFAINKYGKPILNNNIKLYFNISHSGKWVICAIDTKTIGVDVEKIQNLDITIAKQICTKNELNILYNVKEDKQLEIFFKLWTLKESYVKAIGEGLNKSLDSFDVWLQEGIGNYNLKTYLIDKNYILSVCSLNNDFPKEINILNQNNLYDTFRKFI